MQFFIHVCQHVFSCLTSVIAKYLEALLSRGPRGAEWDKEHRGWGKEKYIDIHGQFYYEVTMAKMTFYVFILKIAMLLYHFDVIYLPKRSYINWCLYH